MTSDICEQGGGGKDVGGEKRQENGKTHGVFLKETRVTNQLDEIQK